MITNRTKMRTGEVLELPVATVRGTQITRGISARLMDPEHKANLLAALAAHKQVPAAQVDQRPKELIGPDVPSTVVEEDVWNTWRPYVRTHLLERQYSLTALAAVALFGAEFENNGDFEGPYLAVAGSRMGPDQVSVLLVGDVVAARVQEEGGIWRHCRLGVLSERFTFAELAYIVDVIF